MTLEQRALNCGADLVLEGGGVKGIGLAGAVITLSEAGYVFPRVGGTSAGAIVAALVAGYQTKGVPLSQLQKDMRELQYSKFRDQSFLERHFGLVGMAEALVAHQGLYSTNYLYQWLHSKLDPIGVHTFADLKITDDPGTSLPPVERYRLVVHTSDLTRQSLVRIPWDLPAYLLPEGTPATEEQQVAAIDGYPVVDAVRASMSIPFFFQPFRQPTPEGSCTWVDGGLLQNFPITVFDRNDGKRARWPTFGIKLSAQPQVNVPDRAVHGDVSELLAIAHTALGEWDRYPIDDTVASRTIWVDTMHVSATDFGIDTHTQDALYASGRAAATAFLAEWNAAQPAAGTN
ncbi:MAG TPA: patatin-like phospholipase family protein [Jatrophihabitantaceae bacterium]|jgi:NTE family protein